MHLNKWPDTRLTKLLGITHPIIQAPMAGFATVELVAAVSNAGGLGSLGCGEMTADELVSHVTALRKVTDKPFNLNFMAHDSPVFDQELDANTRNRLEKFSGPHSNPFSADTKSSPFGEFNEEILSTLLELEPGIVSFHFGLPRREWVAELKSRGTLILSTATSVDEARLLADEGVDAVIAQGWEAGGHRGSIDVNLEDHGVGTLALVPQIVDAVSVPVIAAGGIADGRGIAAAFMLGASGVQCGTAFLSCPESGADAPYRSALAGAKDSDTRLSRAFSGRPARARNNAYMAFMAEHRDALPDYPTMYNFSMPLVDDPEVSGADIYFYGQCAALNRILPASELVDLLVAEALVLLNPGG